MAWFYEFLGALVGTGLISRLLAKYQFKQRKGATKAAMVASTTLAIAITIGSLSESFRWALGLYSPAVAVWFVADLIQSRKSASGDGAT